MDNVKIPSIHFEEACVADMDPIVEFCEVELEKMDCPMKALMQINIAVDHFLVSVGVNHNTEGRFLCLLCQRILDCHFHLPPYSSNLLQDLNIILLLHHLCSALIPFGADGLL